MIRRAGNLYASLFFIAIGVVAALATGAVVAAPEGGEPGQVAAPALAADHPVVETTTSTTSTTPPAPATTTTHAPAAEPVDVVPTRVRIASRTPRTKFARLSESRPRHPTVVSRSAVDNSPH